MEASLRVYAADWFRTTEVQLLLESYCFTAVQVAKTTEELRRCNASDLDRLEQLLRIHRSTTMLLLSLATKLRLTPQSTRSAGRTKHTIRYSDGSSLGSYE